jgi:DNA-binding NarL/FixJ family response regulator
VVCVIEENRLAAEYVRGLLEKDPSLCTLFIEGLQTKASLRKAAPIFVLDNFGLALPISEYLRQLRVHYPRARYVVLDRRQSDEELLRLLWFGIHGYLNHSEVCESLLPAVLAVSQGKIWLPRQVLQEYVENIASSHVNRSPGSETLTPREYEITELVKRRFSNREIASTLGIQESTVKFHASNIFSKLRINNRHDLLHKRETGSAARRALLAFNVTEG